MNWHRRFLHPRTRTRTGRMRDAYLECSDEERQLCPAFFERYLAGHGTGSLTAITGVSQGPRFLAEAERIAGSDAVPAELTGEELSKRLAVVLVETLGNTQEVPVAVSGGIDSWLLAALLKSLGYPVRGWYLRSGVEGYCEREQVVRSSRTLGIPCEDIPVSASDFLEAATEFVAITQSPIYNLHPVSKLLLARGLRSRGIDSIVTGDGADQIMRRDWDCDLLPLTHVCFQAAGVRVTAPFLSKPVISACRRRYPDKAPVRELAGRLGVPIPPKRPTLFPEIPLPPSAGPALPKINSAASSGHACLAYTTGLLVALLEDNAPCAASPG